MATDQFKFNGGDEVRLKQCQNKKQASCLLFCERRSKSYLSYERMRQAVSANMCKRFGPNFLWSFTLSATDANRAAIRIARYLTKRPKILVVSWCYHGSVDEAIAIRDPKSGKVVARPGNVGPPVELDKTTRVVEFNDLAAMELELSHRCCS